MLYNNKYIKLSYIIFIYYLFTLRKVISLNNIYRTPDLKDLVDLINGNESSIFSRNISKFHNNNHEKLISELIEIINPWIIANPRVDLPKSLAQPKILLNCSSEKYKNVFTGEVLPDPRFIVDFIPFGYDLEKLEIRLYEVFDIVSAFVLYESPLTQTGKSKPYYFDQVKNSVRFKKFNEKIVYVRSVRENLAKYFSRGHFKSWKMEGSMRYEIIRLLKNVTIPNENRKLQDLILSQSNNINTLATQNDADEMILREVFFIFIF